MVSACLPWAPALLNRKSRLNATRAVPEIFEDREHREEDRHRRQHDADDPGETLVDPVPDESGKPPRRAEFVEPTRRDVFEPEETVGQQG
jgi:hypothetical protein